MKKLDNIYLSIISFKLEISWLCIWSLRFSAIESALEKENFKKKAHAQVIKRKLIAETGLW